MVKTDLLNALIIDTLPFFVRYPLEQRLEKNKSNEDKK
jgi:hypothetical protein